MAASSMTQSWKSIGRLMLRCKGLHQRLKMQRQIRIWSAEMASAGGSDRISRPWINHNSEN